MLGDAVEKLKHAGGLSDINSMELILVVSLEKTDGHFHGFDKIHRTGESNVNNTNYVLHLAVYEHVPVQKLKEVLQAFVQFLFG